MKDRESFFGRQDLIAQLDELWAKHVSSLVETVHHGGRHLDAPVVERAALEFGWRHRGVWERRAGR